MARRLMNSLLLSRFVGPGRAAVLLLLLGFLFYRGTEQLEYPWQWYRVPPFLFSIEAGVFRPGPLLQGLYVTVQITGLSLFLAVAFGLISALFRLSGSIVAAAAARTYVELIRNTPLLVQIFFVYFVLSPVLGLERFFSAVLALSLFEGAYMSEIFRAGILSVPGSQREAAESLGLSPWDTYQCVILPQAFRHVLPPLTGQAISLVKDSALVSTIAVYDLTMRAQAVVAETYLTFEIWFTVAAIYLVITLALSLLMGFMERRFALRI
ncbi:MAG: amino acid ABC transporter permease [Thermodesulfobacteriota bacterium]